MTECPDCQVLLRHGECRICGYKPDSERTEGKRKKDWVITDYLGPTTISCEWRTGAHQCQVFSYIRMLGQRQYCHWHRYVEMKRLGNDMRQQWDEFPAWVEDFMNRYPPHKWGPNPPVWSWPLKKVWYLLTGLSLPEGESV